MSWDCVYLSRNMQGALLLTHRSQGWRCSREVSCPDNYPRDHGSFMGRSEDTWACGTCGAGTAQHAGHHWQLIPGTAWLPSMSPKGFFWESRWGSRLPPTEQGSFSNPWFLLFVWILERPAWDFPGFELSVRGSCLTQLIAVYSSACV